MKKKIGKIVFAIVILAFLLIQVYPIIWLFMASVKPTIELSTTPFALPKVVTFENFIKVFSDGKIGIYMWNSLKVTGISLILIIFLSSTVGYALSKFRIRGKKQIYKFFTFGIMVPVQITLIPLFIFYSKMGILNTSFSLILPQVGFALPLAVMMFVSFYDFVPARAERKKKSQESKKNGLFCGLFDFINRYTVKDFCPECIEEIKGFIQKGAIESENSPDKH